MPYSITIDEAEVSFDLPLW